MTDRTTDKHDRDRAGLAILQRLAADPSGAVQLHRRGAAGGQFVLAGEQLNGTAVRGLVRAGYLVEANVGLVLSAAGERAAAAPPPPRGE